MWWSLKFSCQGDLLASSPNLTIVTSPCVCAKSFQSCPTLWDPMDCSLPGFSVNGISQARIWEWAISSSRGSFQPWNWTTSPALAGGFFTTEPPGKHLLSKFCRVYPPWHCWHLKGCSTAPSPALHCPTPRREGPLAPKGTWTYKMHMPLGRTKTGLRPSHN